MDEHAELLEATGLDPPVVTLVALLALWLRWRAHRRGQVVPVVAYSLITCGPGSAAVAATRLAGLSQALGAWSVADAQSGMSTKDFPAGA